MRREYKQKQKLAAKREQEAVSKVTRRRASATQEARSEKLERLRQKRVQAATAKVRGLTHSLLRDW